MVSTQTGANVLGALSETVRRALAAKHTAALDHPAHGPLHDDAADDEEEEGKEGSCVLS